MTGATTVVATLTKNGREDVRVALAYMSGVEIIDIRIWAQAGGERRPTRKGISLQAGRLPALIAALQKAQDGRQSQAEVDGSSTARSR